MRMGCGMIAHLVSPGLQFGDQFGILFCPETDEKEIGFDPVLIQNIEDSLCIRASWRVLLDTL